MEKLEQKIAELEVIVQSQQIRLRLHDISIIFLAISMLIHLFRHML